MSEADLSWLAVGKSIVVGPSELAKYQDAAERAGLELHWAPAEPEWGADAMRGTRVR